MASSSDSGLLTSFEDMADGMQEVVHENSKGKEKIFESCESTASLEAHESSPSLEVEPDKGDTHVEWESDANKNEVPKVGQVFASEEEVYEFYNVYGKKEGFRVRRDRVERNRNGKIYVRRFTCSKEGHRRFDRRRLDVKKRHADRRTGCMARLVIKLKDDDTWVVKEFIADHNHPKGTSPETHLLQAQKKLQPSHVAGMIDLVPLADGIELMGKQAGGNENLRITEFDYQNFLPVMRTMKKNHVGKEEAQKLMDYFKRIQLENPTFFCAVQVNSAHEITSFFWADARSIVDYGYFGDVVCFETTYRTNKHSWPFAPFIGVNHHRQTILFGAALLLEETTDSFVWLFKTFLEAMSGRKPNTILTDQCATIAKAINIVMPETCHRLCLGHIFQNVAIYLPHLCKDTIFSADFKKCIYNDETEEAFLLAWNQMIEKHGLAGDKWLEGLFKFRKKWALVYRRDSFCADMTTAQRSESINCMLREFLERKLSLPEVVLCYEKVLASKRAKEVKADFDSIQVSPALFINAPMLKQVAKEYTGEAFEMFQKEFQKLLLYNVDNCRVDGKIRKYKVTKIEGGEECLVTLDGSKHEVRCSCKKFEVVGIQCKHVMKVLNCNNIHVLPSQYILKRWTKDARVGVVKKNVENPIQANSSTSLGLRYANICRLAVNLAARGAVSEEAHLVAISSLEKALGNVEAILKETQMTTSNNSIHKLNDGGSPIDFTLTLAQGNERGRPTNARLKSCAIREQVRERVRKTINLDGDNGSNTDQPKQKKGREEKSVSVEGRNNDPVINSSCPVGVPTQCTQAIDPVGICLRRSSQLLEDIGASERNLPCNITTKESDSIHTFQEPSNESGLQQQHSFVPYCGVLPGSFPMPVTGVSVPSVATLVETSAVHVEPIQPMNNLGGPPPSIG